MTEKEKKERENKDSLIGLAQGEIVQRHGEASSQILQAYKGIRVDHNGHLEKAIEPEQQMALERQMIHSMTML